MESRSASRRHRHPKPRFYVAVGLLLATIATGGYFTYRGIAFHRALAHQRTQTLHTKGLTADGMTPVVLNDSSHEYVVVPKLANQTAVKDAANQLVKRLAPTHGQYVFVNYATDSFSNDDVNVALSGTLFDRHGTKLQQVKTDDHGEFSVNKTSKRQLTYGDLLKHDAHRLAALRETIREQVLTSSHAEAGLVPAAYKMALPNSFKTGSFALDNRGLNVSLSNNVFHVKQVLIPYDKLTGIVTNNYLPQADQYRALTKKQTKKMVALTFDDGPDPKLTPKLLKILKKNHVHATFFEVGHSVKRYPAITRQVLADGNTLGNHSWDHPDLATISLDKALSQITRTNQAIYQATGTLPKYVRPPYGAINAKEGRAIDQPIIQWSIDSQDWKSKNTKATIRQVTSTMYGGSVVLMHDIHPTSVAAVPTIIHDLKKKGYQFVTLDELFNHEMLPDYQYFGAHDGRVVGKK